MADRNRWFDMALGIMFMVVGAIFFIPGYSLFGANPLLGMLCAAIPFLAGLILFIVGLQGGNKHG